MKSMVSFFMFLSLGYALKEYKFSVEESVTSSYYNVKIQFIINFIQEINGKYNLAFILSESDVEMLAAVRQLPTSTVTNQFVTVSFFLFGNVDEEVVDKMKTSHLKDNFPVLYNILLPDDKNNQEVEELLVKIKKWDASSKIIFFNGNINVIKSFKSKNIYDIYWFPPVFNKENEVTDYKEYSICMFCDNGDDAVQVRHIWNKKHGFRHPVQLSNSFKGNFYRQQQTMGIHPWHPAIYSIGKDKDGKDIFGGKLYSNYLLLGEMLNLRWNFVLPSDGKPHWDLTASNKTSGEIKPLGILNDLLAHKVDVVGAVWESRHNVYRFSDFSASSYYEGTTYIISTEPPKAIPTVTVVFQWKVCLVIILMILLVPITLYTLRKYGNGGNANVSFGDAVWDGSKIMLWDTIRERQISWGMCILLSSYMIVVFCLITLYTGEYIAMVTEPKYETPPIDSLEQLGKSDKKIIQGALYLYLRDLYKHLPGIYNKIEKLAFDEDKDDPYMMILQKIQEYPKEYVTFFPYFGIKVYIDSLSKKRKIHRSKEGLFNLYYVLLFPKWHTSYKENFNRKINILHAMGLIATLHSGDMPRLIAWDKYNNKVPKTEFIKLMHLRGCFVLLLLGNLLALVAHGFEHLVTSIKDC